MPQKRQLFSPFLPDQRRQLSPLLRQQQVQHGPMESHSTPAEVAQPVPKLVMDPTHWSMRIPKMATPALAFVEFENSIAAIDLPRALERSIVASVTDRFAPIPAKSTESVPLSGPWNQSGALTVSVRLVESANRNVTSNEPPPLLIW